MITRPVQDHAQALAGKGELPAFVYDLAALREHAAEVKAALSAPGAPEIVYAAKANPDAPILQALAPYVDGIEVASGGELAHVREALPEARLAFGGPGKTDDELRLALDLGVERIHVESPYELSRLAEIAATSGREVDVLLRVNLAGDRSGVALAMSGPFGMDPDLIESCTGILNDNPQVRLRGIHAHLASGLDASAMVAQSAEILAWGRVWLDRIGHTGPREFNLGGGMAVDYSTPETRFDWKQYGADVAALAEPGETLRIEPGRSISVYAGWYLTEVLDVKKAHGQWYAVLRGGTMHIRTPVTKQHNHPHDVLTRNGDGPTVAGEPVTLVGQLTFTISHGSETHVHLPFASLPMIAEALSNINYSETLIASTITAIAAGYLLSELERLAQRLTHDDQAAADEIFEWISSTSRALRATGGFLSENKASKLNTFAAVLDGIWHQHRDLLPSALLHALTPARRAYIRNGPVHLPWISQNL